MILRDFKSLKEKDRELEKEKQLILGVLRLLFGNFALLLVSTKIPYAQPEIGHALM